MTDLRDTTRAFTWLRIALAALFVMLVLAMFPYSDDPTGDIKGLMLSWSACGLGVAWLIASWRSGIPLRRPPLFLEILALFLAFNIVAALRSQYPSVAFVELRRYWALLLIYAVTAQVYHSPEQVRRLMIAICAAVTVAACYAFCQKAGWDFFPWADKNTEEYLNLPATFGNPNYAAHTLVPAIIMAIYLASKKHRWFCLGFAAVFLVHLRFTHQRAGLLALAAAVALVVIAHLMRRAVKNPAKAAAATLIAVAVLGAITMASIMVATRFRTGSSYPLDLSLLVRYKSYCSASRMILERPLLGYGAGVYEIEYSRFWTPYEQDWFAQELKMNAHVHNDPLEIAVDAGLPAAGLYLAFLVLGAGYGLLAAYRRRDPLARNLGYASAAFFVAFLVDGLFGFNLRVPVSATILFIMAGCMEGLALGPPTATAGAPLRGRALGWRVVVAVVALVFTVMDARVFASQVYLQLGRRSLHRGDFAAAHESFTRGERLAPWNWSFARQRGLVCLAQKDMHGAVEHFQRSLDRNPQYIMSLVAMARAKMGAGVARLSRDETLSKNVLSSTPELVEAEDYAQKALALAPRFAQAEEVLGRLNSVRALQLAKLEAQAKATAAEVQEAWTQAEGHLSRAIQFGGQNQGELFRLLAQVMVGLKRDDAAEEALIRSAQADPTAQDIWPYYYDFAGRTHRFERLRSTLRGQIRRLEESDARDEDAIAGIYAWLAAIEHKGYNDLESAEVAYREAVRRAPLNSRVWAGYAEFARATKRMDGFLEALGASCDGLVAAGGAPLRHVAAINTVLKEGVPALANATKELLAFFNARSALTSAEDAKEELHWAADWLYERTHHARDDAEATAPALLALGVYFADIGDYSVAQQLYEQAMPGLEADDKSICAQHWAQALVHTHEAPEAVELLTRYLAERPKDLGLRLSLARTYVHANQRDQAMLEYQKLLDDPDLDPDARHLVQDELRHVTYVEEVPAAQGKE
ncbi:MAG TPA: tetratricopeptide repeat protein [Candidatus Hydrogenedentes bacterium]|nr:tetratricopeptide repeat protein [Candidatus Hydrogenedentota bacterium]HPG68628.1 tetratricopeptide repeat protein [Candidatus Hydrogenedentota bacterium]